MSANHQPWRNGRKKKNLIKPLAPTSQSATDNIPELIVNSSNQQTQSSQATDKPTTDANTQKVASTYRSTSLKGLGKDREKKPVKLSVSQKDAKNEFSQDDLVKYWIEYANSLIIEKIHLKNTLQNCKPVLKENYSFEISVYNPSQRDEIAENTPHILGYLNNKLNNNQIKMEIHIAEKEEIEMIYTAAEKYDYLLKKNPNIEKLKELLLLSIH